MNGVLTFLTTNRIAVVFLRWCFWFTVLIIAVVIYGVGSYFVASYITSLPSQWAIGGGFIVLAGIALLMSLGGSKQ